MKVSKLAENIIGSEIIKLAAEVNEKIKNGEKIYNLTIGDFNPKVFSIPTELKQMIVDEYSNDSTNYPAADGMLELRNSVSKLLRERGGLDYKNDEIVIAGGARPVIYSIFKALVDEGDTVIFPVPSWNNNHYTYLNGAKPVLIEASPENNFMPRAADIAPYIKDATLVALCSPQNPTGTVFTKEALEEICDLILAENLRRSPEQKPCYLMYDQIYWALTYGDVKHYNPVSLRPEMKNYTVFVDGISKSLAATGVRVGWTMGPKRIVDKMKAILTHVGAWAPKAEQIATAKYLDNLNLYDAFLVEQKNKVYERLDGFYKGFMKLKAEGYKVNAIVPQAAIYLTIQFSLHGSKTADGKILQTTGDVTKYILDEAKVAVVPFSAFGASENSSWYRLSVGTCKMEDVNAAIESLGAALKKLS
ncbi:MAG: aminotransferase class I/II-fold pyridoxal phosphate-dependent enzyme [Bacteroidia bacterium]|nr:aminotransferase class I/II-fold pyridoxal phosphate-dependent enzyme [Bacteroidia bacterium]